MMRIDLMKTAILGDQARHRDASMAVYPLDAPSAPASAIVWGVWIVMSLMAMRFAWSYGSRVPMWEEWLYVPCVLGAEPFSLSWLWEQYLEHRYPLQSSCSTCRSPPSGWTSGRSCCWTSASSRRMRWAMVALVAIAGGS